ncbi:MAG TPA: aldo/keto reductase [Fimbriimonadaceae bacterium]|nr:aldo/keto reductase [Fimbriimonadaceae bacterium]
MKERRIGKERVGEIGLGCMGMSHAYGPSDEEESLRVLVRSLELGANFWDTADMYGAGKNELLLAKALRTMRDRVFLATKFGNVYDRTLTSHQDLVQQEAGWIVDGTPEYVKKCCDRSLARLGVDHIDLYYQHRVDSRTPIEETVGAMAELVKAGKVRALGLSEASANTIRRAHKTHPIAALQTEYSLWTRDVEAEILPVCLELGISFVPYSPLGRGFLTGKIQSVEDLPPDDWRRMNPRFQSDSLAKNLAIVDQVREVASRHEATPAQIALAWVLAQGDSVIPIPGTKHEKYLEENAGAAEIMLSKRDLDDLGGIAPPEGDRYPQLMMSFLNG